MAAPDPTQTSGRSGSGMALGVLTSGLLQPALDLAAAEHHATDHRRGRARAESWRGCAGRVDTDHGSGVCHIKRIKATLAL